jgi:hypothetical protein
MTMVVVAGALANKHRHGGSQWVRMSWAEAFRVLGFDVVFVEQLHAGGDAATFHAALDTLGLPGALLDGDRVQGMPREQLLDHLESSALLVNISGHLRDPELLARCRLRAFVDLDPGYTQIWHAMGHDIGVLGHQLHFTVGGNVGTRHCTLPDAGIGWRPVRQPVVLDRWPVGQGAFSRFTTVASWRGAFGPVSWNGHSYGVKAHQFRLFADTPVDAGLPFEIALDLHPSDTADRERLSEAGWALTDPSTVSSPERFATYVRESGAEFSVAQGVYVETESGWFSDRTVRYLASGRPALVQDTGFGRSLPVGEGLLSFRTPREAATRARELVVDYARHCRAARALAESHFAPTAALTPLLEACGVAP